jgi:hypothetical protein
VHIIRYITSHLHSIYPASPPASHLVPCCSVAALSNTRVLSPLSRFVELRELTIPRLAHIHLSRLASFCVADGVPTTTFLTGRLLSSIIPFPPFTLFQGSLLISFNPDFGLYPLKVQVGYKIMLPSKKEVWTRQTCHATKEKKVNLLYKKTKNIQQWVFAGGHPPNY